MKICETCQQAVAEDVQACPSCGKEIDQGRKAIDDYRIVKVLREGFSSLLCKAVKGETGEPVLLRLFTPTSGVNEEVAARLLRELDVLKQLPGDYFVRHLEIRQSSDGIWYRVSEWLEAEDWGSILASGVLKDLAVSLDLFRRIALILEGLHRTGHIIPHLILSDLVLVLKEDGGFDVRVDYKLSRFLDPRLPRPGPTLQRLLRLHPDILHGRPLDAKSDIWSLGKIFVEILAGDPEAQLSPAAIDSLHLPTELASLLKVMLAEDPDVRPETMGQVADILDKLSIEGTPQGRRKPSGGLRGTRPGLGAADIRRWLGLPTAAILLLLLTIFLIIWYRNVPESEDTDSIFIDFASRYAGSVAFVATDYQVKDGDSTLYRNRTEGTAFLVDRGGYLLTNRHVACPWLMDPAVSLLGSSLTERGGNPSLAYDLFLWFEGSRAFNRLPSLTEDGDIADIYAVDYSWSTRGSNRLQIAGVARVPEKTWHMMRSPLKDDFAVLKIDSVPEGLEPLPLDDKLEARSLPKLSPVIALGFPLGSRIQETNVNVSVTRGHVRRSFENLFHIDASIHRGNSGGPVVDGRGKVIGIASAVVMDWSEGPIPMPSPQSDLGLVLPITRAALFLNDLREGQEKWNGVLDFLAERKTNEIRQDTLERRWASARDKAENALKQSRDPSLVFAAGIVALCTGDNPHATSLFSRALSMDEQNHRAEFLLCMLQELGGEAADCPHCARLLATDWSSPAEFFGYLCRLMHEDIEGASYGAYSENEASWIHYLLGMKASLKGDMDMAEQHFREAMSRAATDEWTYATALAAYEQATRARLRAMDDEDSAREIREAFADFEQRALAEYRSREDRARELVTLAITLKGKEASVAEKKAVLERFLAENHQRGPSLAALSYYCAMENDWEGALAYADAYLSIPGRENMDRLSLGLLAAQIPAMTGHTAQADDALEAYFGATRTPWFQQVTACLLGRFPEEKLASAAAESPEHLLTAHTALGLKAESRGDWDAAIRHYREALGSHEDTRVEYHFALERLKTVRRNALKK